MLSDFLRGSALVLGFATGAGCFGVAVSRSGRAPTGCEAPPRVSVDTSLEFGGVPIPDGEFRLEVVSTAGSAPDQREVGTLWLWPTPRQDSIELARLRPNRDLSDERQFGATNADLARVGAPMTAGEAPPANSRNPLAPGVLVVVTNHPTA